MKKTLFIAVAILFVFVSCKKDSDPTYFVKLKVNGTWVTWKNALGELGPDLANPAKTDLGITAVNDEQTDDFDITIQIDGNNFTTGTYVSDNSNYWTVISYFRNVAGNLEAYQINDAPNMPPSKYTVNITNITSTTITGNFNGNYLYDDMDDKFIGVTEGEFHVKRVR